jgi:uncharacterized protein
VNRLANQQSLYLRQHAHQAVDWYPWGADALAAARAADKPLLVSVGYSACHWCHVMAHESFDDPYIARLMNTHFLCVKVDREEHPDVDRIYMESVQMMHGHGGWPLNVFCLPDGRPFAGGTYFPPDDRSNRGIVPWPQLLMRVADHYQRHRAELEDNATAILHNLTASNQPPRMDGAVPDPSQLPAAARRILDNADLEYGGFGSAPKFPPAMTLDFLLALRNTRTVGEQDLPLARRIDQVINTTLTGMAHGGLYDQIGGGFCRYSVDRHWLIPHFEKMLYDNALLIDIYSRAWQRYPKPLYAAVVGETIDWLQREMRAPGGGYYAAIDADSEGGEGSFYVWEPAEIAAVLGAERAAAFCRAYDIRDEGNFEHSGKSQPALLEPDYATRSEWAAARQQLLRVRNRRPRPATDTKRLTAWNALMCRALAQAAVTFGRPDWWATAVELGDWLWHTQTAGGTTCYRLAYDGQPTGVGTLDDAAFCAEAMLALAAHSDWLQPGSHRLWFERAATLGRLIDEQYGDESGPGYYFNSRHDDPLVHRAKDWYDQAIPAGNSALLHVLSGLYAGTGEIRWGQTYTDLSRAHRGTLTELPQAVPYALSAITQELTGIAVVRAAADAPLEPLRAALAKRPWRRTLLLAASGNEHGFPASGYQLCIGSQCLNLEGGVEAVAEAVGGGRLGER